MAKLADLLSVGEARQRILSHFRPLGTERVSIAESLGRILAESVAAGMDLPPFANSSMDGFALRSAATDGAGPDSPVLFQITDHIPAGSWSERAVTPDSCARIMTGAPLPPGADAVIPFEQVDDRGDAIAVFEPVRRGASVRPEGNDVRSGAIVLEAGTEVRAPQVALLAALGMSELPVRRRPRVAILSTGDELIRPGEALLPGQIYNSNTPMLAAAVREAGGEPEEAGAAGDDPRSIAEALSALQGADLLITSGGASVGDFDHVKDVVQSAGDLSFWRVRVRPGKPLLFGSMGGTPVVGLPGNPTSAMVTFEEFVRPAVRTMLGAPAMRPEIEAVLDETIDNRGGRQTYFRVRLRQEGCRFHARLAGGQDSAMLHPLAQAHGLLIAPEDREELRAGEAAVVQVWRLPGE